MSGSSGLIFVTSGLQQRRTRPRVAEHDATVSLPTKFSVISSALGSLILPEGFCPSIGPGRLIGEDCDHQAPIRELPFPRPRGRSTVRAFPRTKPVMLVSRNMLQDHGLHSGSPKAPPEGLVKSLMFLFEPGFSWLLWRSLRPAFSVRRLVSSP